MALDSLKDLFIDQLKDIYSAETQLTKALPKMAKGATNEDLREGFLTHLQETKGQLERLEKIFKDLDEKPTGKTCAAMQGLIEEGSEVLKEEGNPSVIDAALIAAAQRVEHYEMAAYGCVRAFAELLEMDNAVKLLQETYDEESATDEKLSELADSTINSEAMLANDANDEDDSPSSSKTKKTSGKRARA